METQVKVFWDDNWTIGMATGVYLVVNSQKIERNIPVMVMVVG
jgi:hypothetical protein